MLVMLLFSVVIHEVAHAVVALWCGDPTAKRLGRITLNPAVHIDPFMTILLPVMLLWMSNGQFAFGGAKPVPVNPFNLHNPKRDMMLVSIAGPLSNILLAVIFMIAYRIALEVDVQEAYRQLLRLGAMLNVILATFNMIPIPPLDGSKVLMGVLPDRQAELLRSIEPYGMFIIMGLLMVGGLSRLIGPPVQAILNGITDLVFLF